VNQLVLWQMEHLDKFDMYSVGILFLQVGSILL
jgi:hypothetical protein